MTDHDDQRPSLEDSEFDAFLAELEGSRSTTVPEPVKPVPSAVRVPAAPPPPSQFGIDVDLSFDDDDDGATRVGEIPKELLAALGRKPAQEAATVPPPAPGPDDLEVSFDDFGPSLAVTVPPPANTGGLEIEGDGDVEDRRTVSSFPQTTATGAEPLGEQDEDEIVIEAGGDEDEVVIEAGGDEDEVVIEAGGDEDEVVIEAGGDEDEVVVEAPRTVAATPSIAQAASETPPLLTLTGKEQLAARARSLEAFASTTARADAAWLAAASLAERAGADSTGTYLQKVNVAESRRAEIRRGTRTLARLESGDLGGDVEASTLVREAVRAARAGDERTVSALLEKASDRARTPALARFLSLALARSAERAGDEKRATAIRLRTVGEDATTGTFISIARAQIAQGDRNDASATLKRAASRESTGTVAAVLARWIATFDGSHRGGSHGEPKRLADIADAVGSAPDATRAELLGRLEAGLGDEARSVVLAQLGSTQARAGSLEAAAESFDTARRHTARAALVDAVRDAEARRAANPTRLAPTPAQDDGDGGVLAALGRALVRADASDETLAALEAAGSDVRAARAVNRLKADVAANIGNPSAWIEANNAESSDGEGRDGLAATRALVLSRAGDRDAAIEQLDASDTNVGTTTRALLLATVDRDAAASALSESSDESLHVRALASRFARKPWVTDLSDLLRDAPDDLTVALRLEQRARAEGQGAAAAAALEALAAGAETDVDRRKLRLLSASGGSASNALELAPDDPVLLAEALLDQRVPSHTRDHAVEVLTQGASPIAAAVLRARASTLAQVDGSPSDAALQLRAAHDAVPNEPSMGASVEFAELAAGQTARLTHRFFATARSESADAPTRARAFVRLAELDRRERGDTAAALASFTTALELAPDHVPTLRALESIACDRAETEGLADLEARLAASLTPGNTADAHARLAIRHRFARGGHPASDVAAVAFEALARGTKSDRLLRWVEHAARDVQDTREQAALERRLEGTADPADRAELGLRIAVYALRRGDGERALAAIDGVLRDEPSHEVALFERAMILDTDSSRTVAAQAHEEAARVAVSPRNAVRHLVRAAEHLEANGDLVGARDALRAAHGRSPEDSQLLSLLADLFERAQDLPSAISTVEERIAHGGTPEELAPWYRRLAHLGELGGSSEVARGAYRQLLLTAPDDTAVLRRVAELSLAAGDGPTAADALMRLARIQKAPDELAWVFLGLGDCYTRLVPDARRAEASFVRVIAVDPPNVIANERLVSLLVGLNRLDEALGRVEAYEGGTHDAALARRLRLAIAHAHEKAGDFRSAETLLDGLRRSQPTDVAIQLDLARFFEARGGGPPLSMHLTRALADLRRAFEEHPSVAALLAILEIQRRRGRADAVACTEAAAMVLGVDRDPLGRSFAPRVVGAGAKAHVREIEELLAPRSLPEGTRAALVLGSPAIEQAFPFDAKAFHAERLPKESPIRAQALSAAHAFGFNDVVILVTSAAPRICVPVASSPLTIVIGRELPQLTSDAEREFLFARAAKIAASGMAFALRMQPAQVAFTVHALIHAHQPGHVPAGIDAAQLESASKAIAKHLPRDQHERGPLCVEMASRPNFEPQRIGLAAAELGDRVALVSTGQILAAVSSVIRLAGRELDTVSGFDARLELVRSTPEAWGLLLFALSDAHAEARQRAGIPV